MLLLLLPSAAVMPFDALMQFAMLSAVQVCVRRVCKSAKSNN
jgi:hypothetical protein